MMTSLVYPDSLPVTSAQSKYSHVKEVSVASAVLWLTIFAAHFFLVQNGHVAPQEAVVYDAAAHVCRSTLQRYVLACSCAAWGMVNIRCCCRWSAFAPATPTAYFYKHKHMPMVQHGGPPCGLLHMAAGDMVCDVHWAGLLCHDVDAHDSLADQAIHGQVCFFWPDHGV